MTRTAEIADRLFTRWVLDRPVAVIVCLLIVLSFLGYKARDFKIDASAETLLLENDQDLRYARTISTRYGIEDFLIISYSPRDGDLLSENTLKNLRRLRNELRGLDSVSSVLTILDVPLLASPPPTLDELSKGIHSLQSPSVDKKLARIELRSSPYYRDLIVSRNMKTTALVVYLKPDPIYRRLIQTRDGLLDRRADGTLSEPQATELKATVRQIRRHLDRTNRERHRNIAAIRAIMAPHRAQAELFLGGIGMIADDMITYIKTDLKGFGLGVFALLVLMLGIIFRQVRWIVLPMLCCLLAVIAMMGVLGMFGWEVTVISSNFIALQLIITLAIVVHLIVRYRELLEKEPASDQRTLIRLTVRSKFIPCLYAALTTIAGFSSLILCDIKPVIHFGWMMSAGILLSLTLTFLLFPAGVRLLAVKAPRAGNRPLRLALTTLLARFTVTHGTWILILTILISILALGGISRLEVENSFIDYFKQNTEIHAGMKVIDQQLGGTTPLDIIVRFENPRAGAQEAAGSSAEASSLPSDEDEAFFDELEAEAADEDPDKYWFLDRRMETIEKVHDYLEGLAETGKVLSLGTVFKIARELRGGKSLDSFEMAVLYSKLPADYKRLIIAPYVYFDENETRFFIRIKDSLKTLRRNALLKKIRGDLVEKLGLAPERVRLAGAMVLYNNMLQSLFASQIKTIGAVALALLVMFLVLFRSLKLALIALFPNLFASAAVLGVMGWMNIPLDMMTITIAAISVGIAVDNTIHYICRFRDEIGTGGDYHATLYRCHGSIGHAMYYTSVIIILGFSILVLSSFWPTIYFGLFTGLAMLMALIASLTLLPELLVVFKPFGRR